MAYTPKTWQCDDTVTADELNRMEQGIAEASQGGGGGAPLIVNDVDNTLDKTWQEIHDAFVGGQNVIIHSDALTMDELVAGVKLYNGNYLVASIMDAIYGTSSANGYPERYES